MASKDTNKDLFIFVNRRKFGADDGVTPKMTGGAIASLVNVAADNAVIRSGNTEKGPEIAVDQEVDVEKAAHFVVTRKIVDGG